jgi:hypothetical protein
MPQIGGDHGSMSVIGIFRQSSVEIAIFAEAGYVRSSVPLPIGSHIARGAVC